MTIDKTTGMIAASAAVHQLKPIPHKAIDGPDTIIIHYTAGTSGESSANWLADPTSKVSAHVVIDRSGRIYQVIPFHKVAWHAGQSAYGGRTGFNDFSIGIELDNAGYLQRDGDAYVSSYGKRYAPAEVIQARHRNENFTRFWHTYSDEQLLACRNLCLALIDAYPEIDQILGHDEISPGRKQDPGPAFPMEHFRSSIIFKE
jgi:N-acetylmuramoyl-L-alanine amidase